MLATKLLSAMAGGSETLYVDDCFAAHTYTGNGSTQTITNGIDLAGKGGMVWCKRRDSAQNHGLFDSVTGPSSSLNSASTTAQIATSPDITSFNSDGVTYGAPGSYIYNFSGGTYVNWTFRKAPKFFDVVTWTGNGVSGRAIPHSLGIAPGFIMVKCTSNTYAWICMHRSLNTVGNEYLVLNTTAAKTSFASAWGSTAPTDTNFYVSSFGENNTTGATYVAYVFAHDAAADGIIQCGSFTTDGSGNATVNLGWEPQFSMWKTSSVAGNWYISDTSRGLTADGAINYLSANTTGAEAAGTGYKINATGFTVAGFGASTTYIYLAIRRPNKPPTVGTQVYNAIARTGTGAAATVTGVGFAPDLVMPFNRSGVAGVGHPVYDRLRGALKSLRANLTNIENSDTASLTAFGMDGMTLGADGAEVINSSRESSIINHFFKRAPGVFDVVCYAGQSSVQTVTHGLAATPELIFIKNKTSAQSWAVYSASIPVTKLLRLDTTNAAITDSKWNDVAPTSTVFYLTNVADVNSITNNYVAYLFATKAGISKVFNYTGNGGSQTINCGFTTGARFILIKRTDSTGDWYVWDTVRGIIAGNDPHLSLNTTAAEVTTNDSIDPDSSGFIVNQVAATNINVTSATYIGLAFA